MLITDVVIFTSAFANGVVVYDKIARNNFVCYDVTQFLLQKNQFLRLKVATIYVFSRSTHFFVTLRKHEQLTQALHYSDFLSIGNNETRKKDITTSC